MLTIRDLPDLLKRPKEVLPGMLETAADIGPLVTHLVLPLVAIRSVAVLLRSSLMGAPFAGVVLGVGNFALQMATWLALALILPTLFREAKIDMTDDQAFGLASIACIPLWIGGIMYVFPEHVAWLYVWSRLVVLGTAAYGALLVWWSFDHFDVPAKSRAFLLGAFVVAAVVIYFVLFAPIGIGTSVILAVVDVVGS